MKTEHLLCLTPHFPALIPLYFRPTHVPADVTILLSEGRKERVSLLLPLDVLYLKTLTPLVLRIEMCLHLRLLPPPPSTSPRPILIQFLPVFQNCSHAFIILVPWPYLGVSWPYLLQHLQAFNTLGHCL